MKWITILLLTFISINTIGELNHSGVSTYDNFYRVHENRYRTILETLESGGNQWAVGRGYYRGKFQIGKTAAKDVGVPYSWLFNPQWNDSAMVRLRNKNWEYLKDCHNYVGDTINGIPITKAGMVAGAHLKGHVWVRKYLTSRGKIIGRDANGVSIEVYINAMKEIYLR